jgi:hypothetical protein
VKEYTGSSGSWEWGAGSIIDAAATGSELELSLALQDDFSYYLHLTGWDDAEDTTSSHAIEFSDSFLPDGGRTISSSSFNNPVHVEAVTADILALAVGDLDGDGDDDLIAAMDVPTSGEDSQIMIFRNDKQYTSSNFNTGFTITLSNSNFDGDVFDVASYDIDGDGDDDIVAGSQDNRILIMESPGDTQPSTETWTVGNWDDSSADGEAVTWGVGDDALAIDVGNLAGSSDKDIVVGTDTQSGNDELQAFTHPGSDPFGVGTWSEIASLERGSSVAVRDVTIGDFDDDGDNDVAFVHTDTDQVGFSSNDGDDTFTPQGDDTFTDENFDIAILKAYDVDGDGDDDVVGFDDSNDANEEVAYLKSDGGWGWSVISIASIDFFNVKDAVVADFDGDGDGDMAMVGSWTANVHVETVYTIDNNGDTDFTVITESSFSPDNTDEYTVNAIVEMDVGDDDNPWKDLVIAIDPDTAGSSLEIAIFQNAIPEFTTLLAPIVSVIGIVCWNYRRREAAGQ